LAASSYKFVLLDIVFSLDSVITAVGMTNEYWVMATAIVIAVLIMLGASGPVSGFVNRHPTVKMLALSFLLLIGMALVTDGAGFHVPKGYIYAAIGFSVMVEGLNQLAARRRRLRTHPTPGPTRLAKDRIRIEARRMGGSRRAVRQVGSGDGLDAAARIKRTGQAVSCPGRSTMRKTTADSRHQCCELEARRAEKIVG
jgi:hypothetical protein